MPYKLYTSKNIEKKYVLISEALTYLENNQKQQFLKNIEKWDLKRDDNTYDIIEYSKRYCEIDFGNPRYHYPFGLYQGMQQYA